MWEFVTQDSRPLDFFFLLGWSNLSVIHLRKATCNLALLAVLINELLLTEQEVCIGES